jgi:hypothetical protein
MNADGFGMSTTLVLSNCPSVDISNCNGHLSLGSCFVYNHQGACDTRSIDSRCVEYTASFVATAEPQCEAKCGVWRTEPCPVPDTNTQCCDYNGEHVCATGHDAIDAMRAECVSTGICHC